MSRSGAELVKQGFRQVSRKYRIVARVPLGKTPLEALVAVDPRLAQHYIDQFRHNCTDQYTRVYAKGDDQLELTPEEFEDFRQAASTQEFIEERTKPPELLVAHPSAREIVDRLLALIVHAQLPFDALHQQIGIALIESKLLTKAEVDDFYRRVTDSLQDDLPDDR